MNNILVKINKYKKKHFYFLKNIYFKHNYIEDSKEGNDTFIDFITVKKSNERIKETSLFYEVVVKNEIIGLFELDENHLTLLYIDSKNQKNGIGSNCIDEIKKLLKDKYEKLTVFSSVSSTGFYLKNNFIKLHDKIRDIKGMKYYLMELNLTL